MLWPAGAAEAQGETPAGRARRPAGGRGAQMSVRIAPNLFGIPFGITGLAEAWTAAEPVAGVPLAVADGLNIVAAIVWTVLVAAYLAQGWRQVAADARDPVLAPFTAVPGICAMLLGAALAGPAPAAGRAVVAVALAVTAVLGGWLTGRWMTGQLDRDRVHPGYFLPTVAGGLVGAFAAAEVHLRAVAGASFGIGVLCWILLGSVLLNRLFYAPGLPAPLLPTMAIELAPPAVAGIAYFALTGGAVNLVSRALVGYAVLMALVQLSLLPAYLRLRFSPGFWAFAFSFAAAATDALLWIRRADPPGAAGYAIAILVAITALLAAITARSAVALGRGQFLPPRAPAAAGQAAARPS
jgi:tellurite resistance protein